MSVENLWRGLTFCSVCEGHRLLIVLRVAHFRDVAGQSAGEQAELSLWKLLSS